MCGQPPQVGLVERSFAREGQFGAQRRDVRQQPGARAADELRDLREQFAGAVGPLARGGRVAGGQCGPGPLHEPPGLHRVDPDLFGGHPVAARHAVHRQPEAPYPGDQCLNGAQYVFRRLAVPHRVDERGGGHRPAAGVDELPDHRRQPLTADRPSVDGERAEGRDLHGSSIPHNADRAAARFRMSGSARLRRRGCTEAPVTTAVSPGRARAVAPSDGPEPIDGRHARWSTSGLSRPGVVNAVTASTR